MPTYEFRCDSCTKVFEEVRTFGDFSCNPCPHCASRKVSKLISLPAAPIFKQKRGTSREDNFEYVAKENMERAREERRAHEEISKDDFRYPEIDDISSGEHFGPVE
jgi:putative FmdB family regulatory protein